MTIHSAVTDDTTSDTAEALVEQLLTAGEHSMLNTTEPEHTRLRKLLEEMRRRYPNVADHGAGR